MIYVSAYNSLSLDDDSDRRFAESGIVYVTITDTDKDASASSNKHIHTDCDGYPTWDKLSLCLRTDWKRLKCWPVEEGSVLTSKLEEEFGKVFNRPAIAKRVAALLETYASHLHNEYGSNSRFVLSIRNVYCISKEEYLTLQWGFAVVDEGSDEEGLQRFREGMMIGAIDKAIGRVQGDYYQ